MYVVEKLLRRNLGCLKLNASFAVIPLTTASVDVLTVAKRLVASAALEVELPQVDKGFATPRFSEKCV